VGREVQYNTALYSHRPFTSLMPVFQGVRGESRRGPGRLRAGIGERSAVCEIVGIAWRWRKSLAVSTPRRADAHQFGDYDAHLNVQFILTIAIE
jgi:hypothetical protein